MRRTDNEYWQRLRKDKRSAAAGLLAILAWLTPSVALNILLIPGTHAQARRNPFYWLILAPVAWWATALSSYEPGPVRFLKPALIIGPLVTLTIALAATYMGKGATPFWIATAVSILSALASWFLYRGSMLEREGPAR